MTVRVYLKDGSTLEGLSVYFNSPVEGMALIKISRNMDYYIPIINISYIFSNEGEQ